MNTEIGVFNCPFCDESGYDLSRLKWHLEYDCGVYREDEIIEAKDHDSWKKRND